MFRIPVLRSVSLPRLCLLKMVFISCTLLAETSRVGAMAGFLGKQLLGPTCYNELAYTVISAVSALRQSLIV